MAVTSQGCAIRAADGYVTIFTTPADMLSFAERSLRHRARVRAARWAEPGGEPEPESCPDSGGEQLAEALQARAGISPERELESVLAVVARELESALAAVARDLRELRASQRALVREFGACRDRGRKLIAARRALLGQAPCSDQAADTELELLGREGNAE